MRWQRIHPISVSFHIVLFFGLVGLLAVANPALGQQDVGSQAGTSEPDVPEKAGKELRAFRITGSSPQIDGRFDEDVWASADSFDDFVQTEPDNMEAPTERTVVQVAYDDRYVYVAIYNHMRDSERGCFRRNFGGGLSIRRTGIASFRSGPVSRSAPARR